MRLFSRGNYATAFQTMWNPFSYYTLVQYLGSLIGLPEAAGAKATRGCSNFDRHQSFVCRTYKPYSYLIIDPPSYPSISQSVSQSIN